MRLRHNSSVRIILHDNSVVSGTVTRSWRWRIVRLTGAFQMLPQGGRADAEGPVLIPHRSIMYVMELGGASDER